MKILIENSKKILKTAFNFSIPETRLAWRSGAICGLAYYLSLFVLKISNPTWLIFSTYVCIQTNVGSTMIRGRQRFVGTFLGCGLGFLMQFYFHENVLLLIILFVLALFLAVHKLSQSYTYYIFAFSFALMIFLSFTVKNSLHEGMMRISDVGIGVLLGTLGSFFLWPTFAYKTIKTDVLHVTQNLQALISGIYDWTNGLKNTTEIFDLKTESAKYNQIFRNRLYEIQHEFRRSASTIKIYEKFIIGCERVYFSTLDLYYNINRTCKEENTTNIVLPKDLSENIGKFINYTNELFKIPPLLLEKKYTAEERKHYHQLISEFNENFKQNIQKSDMVYPLYLEIIDLSEIIGELK